MKCSLVRPLRCMVLCLGFGFVITATAPAQRVPVPAQPQRPVINLDKELEGPVAPDRAASYYHYSLAKWYEDAQDLQRAISEMQTALKYNPNSPAVYLEMASLLAKSGNTAEAIKNAEEAIRLDPKDPDPHWFMVNVYFRPAGGSDSMQKAIQELEKLKELTPSDERVYFMLGGAYFVTDKSEKAIEAYEKYQSLSTSSDSGYREIARYYERKGNEEKSIEYLNKGLKVQPDSPETLYMLAQIYKRQGKNKLAIPLYQRLTEVAENANLSEVNGELAVLLIDERQYAEALKVLDELVKNPQMAADSSIQGLRGKALFGMRKYSETVQALQPIVDKDPNAIEAAYYLGCAYQEIGKFPEAAKIFEALVQKPVANSDEARNNHMVFEQQLAADYIAMGSNDKAIAIFQDMAKEDPKRGNPRVVDAYRLSKQYDKAISFGKEQYEKDPANIELAISYARALADGGKAKQGAEVLSKLLETNADNIEVYVHLSQIYLQDKRYADAEKVLRRAQDKTKDTENNERLNFQLAQVYEKLKDFDRADSVLKEILKVNPQNAGALNYIGYMLADRGVRLEEAVKYVKEALAIEPQNGAYLDSLGWAFFKLNDLANAEKYLLEAVALVKDDPTIEDHLGDLYFKTGDLKKAEEYWKKSVSAGTEQDEILKVRRKLDSLQDTLRKKQTK